MRAQTSEDGVRRATAALSILAMLGLAACAPDTEEAEGAAEEDGQSAEETADAGQDGGEGTEADEDTGDGGQAQGSGEDVTPDPEEALQSVTYPMQGPLEGEMTMGVHGLEVGEQGMLLTLTFVPEYEMEDGEPAHFVQDMHSVDLDNITTYLLPTVSDRENLKAYQVPREERIDTGGGWQVGTVQAWASEVDVQIRPGETFTLWAYYPTPEDDIETADVAVVPGAPEFRDVPIEWGGHGPAEHESSEDDAEDSDE